MSRCISIGVLRRVSILAIGGALILFGMPKVARAQANAQSKTSSDCEEMKAQLAAATQRLARMKDFLSDWPDMERYREEDTKLGLPAKDEQRVVFMGDSITDFWNHPEFGGFFPGKPYMDRGISGQTTPQMLVRFRQDVIALDPKVVVILAGTNDIAGNTGPMTLGETEDNLATMAELSKMHGIRVVLASLLPVNDYESNRERKPIVQTVDRPPTEILELNAWIKKYATENGDIYLDYFTAMADERGFLKKELSADGLHPNTQGYAVMAPLAEQAIQSALSTHH